MKITKRQLRHIIRESIFDSMKNFLGFGDEKKSKKMAEPYLAPGPNEKPPFKFKEATGIDVIGKYKFPEPFNDYDGLDKFLKENILSDFLQDPGKYHNILTPIYKKMIEINPELESIISVSDTPSLEQNSKILNIIYGVASAFKVQDIAPFVLGTIDRRKNQEYYAKVIERKTGVAPEWMLSKETFEEIMRQI